MQPGEKRPKATKDQRSRHLPGLEARPAPRAPIYHPLQELLPLLARWVVAYHQLQGPLLSLERWAAAYHTLQEPLLSLERWVVAYHTLQEPLPSLESRAVVDRPRGLLHQYWAAVMGAVSQQRNRPLPGGKRILPANPPVRQPKLRQLIQRLDRTLAIATERYLLRILLPLKAALRDECLFTADSSLGAAQ